jgi:hypothetical protein
MFNAKLRHRAISGSILVLAGLSTPAGAQSVTYKTPHLTTATGTESVQLGGVTFANQGLVGVGRLAASTRDFAGETLGSFSGMALDLGTWRRDVDVARSRAQ